MRTSARRALTWVAVAPCLALAWSCSSKPPTGPSDPGNPTPDAPKISCPAAPPAVISPAGQPVTVAYGTATVTGGSPPVALSCSPATTTPFPVGTTPVTCSATDSRQRTDLCTFNVVVQQAPRITLTSFVAFGDSITYGEDGDPTTLCGSNNNVEPSWLRAIRPLQQVATPYPARLRGLLQARYPAQSGAIDVANRGNRGEPAGPQPGQTETAQQRFNRVLSESPYQAVLLMEGTNDIFYGDASMIPNAISGLRGMLRDAKARNVRPFLATVPPMVPGKDRSCGNRQVVPLNDQIRLLAAQESVKLVDVYAGLGTGFAQYIGPDGLHPNQAGYAKIAEIFLDALTSTLEVPGTTTTGMPVLAPFAVPVPTARPSIAPRSERRR